MLLDIYSQTKYIHTIKKVYFFKLIKYIKVNSYKGSHISDLSLQLILKIKSPSSDLAHFFKILFHEKS